MAWRCGSFSRSLLSAARPPSSSTRLSPSLTRRCLPPLLPQRSRPHGSLFSNPRNVGELGGIQSLLLPTNGAVASACLTLHLTVEARACCELSQVLVGTPFHLL